MTDVFDSLLEKKAKKSKEAPMEMTDPVEVEKLTKALHEFHISPGQKGTKLPDAYIQDYLDAFIEEAYEHEYEEARHRAPRLEGGDPYMFLARCVYNELLVFAVHNRNLLRAITKFSIRHPKYVLERMVFMGLCRVNTENYTADRDAQVGGYHPEKVEPLAQESPSGFTRSMDSIAERVQREEQEHKIRGGSGVLADGPEMVTLRDDGIDPFAALKKSIDSRPDALGRRFVLDQNEVVATIDTNCIVHGTKDLTKSMNLGNVFAHCTCPNPQEG